MEEKLQKADLDVVGAGEVVDGGDRWWLRWGRRRIQQRACLSFWRVNCQQIWKYVRKDFQVPWETVPLPKKTSAASAYPVSNSNGSYLAILSKCLLNIIFVRVASQSPNVDLTEQIDAIYSNNSTRSWYLATGVPILVGATVLQRHPQSILQDIWPVPHLILKSDQQTFQMILHGLLLLHWNWTGRRVLSLAFVLRIQQGDTLLHLGTMLGYSTV